MIFTVCSYQACSIFSDHGPFTSLVHPPSPFASENQAKSGFTPLR